MKDLAARLEGEQGSPTVPKSSGLVIESHFPLVDGRGLLGKLVN